MKTIPVLVSALLAFSTGACGGPIDGASKAEGGELAASSEASQEDSTLYCDDLTRVVNAIREKRGDCVPNYKNEEPLAYDPAICAADFSTACPPADLGEVAAYIACLDAVPACDPAQQDLFDEQIDSCLDHAQQVLTESCIEVVIGD